MPFINTKTNVKLSKEQEVMLKSELGQAISIIPGKSETWLMVGFQDEYKLYFQGDDSQPTAFVEVSILGTENKQAFAALTDEICKIYKNILGISPDHVYVKYHAVSNWGWNGGNF